MRHTSLSLRSYCTLRTTASIVAAFVFVGGGTSCALPTDGVADEPVATQTEPLNQAPNFRFGIQTWLYNTRGALAESPSMTSVALGSGFGSSSWAGLPNNLSNPNGLRLTLTKLTSGISLEGIDFRILIIATDRGEASGSWAWTPWASDGGGWSFAAYDGSDHIDADNFAVAVQTRNWPAGNNRRLVDFAIGIQPCETRSTPPSFIDCDVSVGQAKFTGWMSQFGTNQTWWTEIATNQGSTAIDGAKLDLVVNLQ